MGSTQQHDIAGRLLIHRHSPIHKLPAQVKLTSLVAFVFLVVLTPVGEWWAFGVHLSLILTVILLAQLPLITISKRMVIETPFLVFAILMPFFSAGPYVEYFGFELSESGLIAAAGLLCKGTLGVMASITLAATTPMRDLLSGFEKLRVPKLIIQIAGFMVRYIDVIVDEMRRMKIARQSRGFLETGIKAWPVIAKSAGALFIRAYERGERIHLAMLSRGYQGTMPTMVNTQVSSVQWVQGLMLPLSAAVVLITAWILR